MKNEQGKTEKWKTETGIYMYNYGRNIALKLRVVVGRGEKKSYFPSPCVSVGLRVADNSREPK